MRSHAHFLDRSAPLATEASTEKLTRKHEMREQIKLSNPFSVHRIKQQSCMLPHTALRCDLSLSHTHALTWGAAGHAGSACVVVQDDADHARRRRRTRGGTVGQGRATPGKQSGRHSKGRVIQSDGPVTGIGPRQHHSNLLIGIGANVSGIGRISTLHVGG